ncbi:uncharacterized protein CLUP02_07461 [Colletotrichum lupini]|uniref:Uncharacterized protein n=1 Tax=Colletotrichum lupini TaxID=145971 RepID=A0A9Q8SR99_9PEZI|nr:uncharacterized protein CLUP02_07461 [Colletotrichum lupini]UQC81975.1 hypothetical protein CLUP02_07461 [Colletotrichum lupini]
MRLLNREKLVDLCSAPMDNMKTSTMENFLTKYQKTQRCYVRPCLPLPIARNLISHLIKPAAQLPASRIPAAHEAIPKTHASPPRRPGKFILPHVPAAPPLLILASSPVLREDFALLPSIGMHSPGRRDDNAFPVARLD